MESILNLLDGLAHNFRAQTRNAVVTRGQGLERLQAFLSNAGRRYAVTRNYDFGPTGRSNVSLLSPWIRHRLVREDEVVRAVLGRHAYSSAEKFIQEVVWRTYWKGWLEQRPGVWREYQRAVVEMLGKVDADPARRQRWEQAIAGRTGIACFDAWAHELVATGYLHNHTRMWFASIWVFTLGLPWQLGADFFLRHLLDGDPASNTLSWRWVAGLQTRGKTYLARPDNIAKYTDGRFAEIRGLATEAKPVDGPPPPAPQPLPNADTIEVDGEWALLVHEDDCHPESLALPPTPPKAIAGFVRTHQRSPLGAGAAAGALAEGAVRDALTRAADRFGRSTTFLDANKGVDKLAMWARSAGVSQIVTPYAPVGPVGDALDVLRDLVAAEGIAVLRSRRPWDSHLWPFATKGFFAFKERIPNALRSLGVG